MPKTSSHKQKPTLPPEKGMAAVPMRNQAAEIQSQNDRTILWLPARQRWWMNPPFNWLLQYRRRKGIELDNLGREVWDACDGNRSVENIVSDFANRHNLQFHEARIAVSKFLQSLMERNLIALAVDRRGQGNN